MLELQSEFTNKIMAVYGQKGKDFLTNLETIISSYEKRWHLNIHRPYELSYNYVAPATRKDGTELVIKIGVPTPSFTMEYETLRMLASPSVVKLVDEDIANGVLLLEKIQPGNTLATVDDDVEATEIASTVMAKLWRPLPSHYQLNLPTMTDREKSLESIVQSNWNGCGPISKVILYEALTLFKQLHKTIDQQYILHGDLHHYNILQSDNNEWKIIDPKGLVGDREYDVIQFLLNKLPYENKISILDRRINILVEQLGLNKERILGWGFAHSVLSTCWSVEEGSLDENFFHSIGVFQQLIERG
ncbi:aminoglycoside phosphotransferase family protein [Sutcliffiella cohnii]|nr:aminoglycoside phosphotransferase family protein [Sutcliffiella cohnii]